MTHQHAILSGEELDRAMQRARRLRSEAFASHFGTLLQAMRALWPTGGSHHGGATPAHSG
ncbi:MAG: RSP_7527 family protein [Methyloligellaceae bacterium]